MQTKLIETHKNRIRLTLDNGKKGRDQIVLAEMQLIYGQKLWILKDIRLCEYQEPNQFGVNNAGDFCSSIYPKPGIIDADFIKSMLHDFVERPSGQIVWPTYDGIVKGPEKVTTESVGYFRKSEGLSLLHQMQVDWAEVENLESQWRKPNPNRQPSMEQIVMASLRSKQENLTRFYHEAIDTDSLILEY